MARGVAEFGGLSKQVISVSLSIILLIFLLCWLISGLKFSYEVAKITPGSSRLKFLEK